MKKIISLALVLSTLLISACTSTKTVGSKVSETTTPISQLLVIANDRASFGGNSAFGKSASSSALELGVKDIFVRLHRQLPAVFELNGINTEFQLSSTHAGSNIKPKMNPSHVLNLNPANGTYNTQYGHINVEINGNLAEIATKKVIWKGGAKFGKAGMAVIDDKSANEFAKALLMQLKKDGVLSYPTAEPVMPK